jgi:hypothetical protein
MQLKPIECKIHVIEYVEDYGSNFAFENVAISARKTEEYILKDLQSVSAYTVSVSKLQYRTIFEPLFEEIGKLNKQIEELNNNK